jgi:hypothetical protein
MAMLLPNGNVAVVIGPSKTIPAVMKQTKVAAFNLLIPGPPGAGISTYTYIQSPASPTWTITHNLSRFPSVSVVDSTGRLVEGDVQYVSSNQIIVSFSSSFAGNAYLN